MKAIILFFFITATVTSYAQNDWVDAGKLYSDGNVEVQLQYRFSTDICRDNTKPGRFRYIIKGRQLGFDYFLNWKMEYDDCNGGTRWQSNSVNIGNFVAGVPTENMDWSFAGPSVSRYFYDATTSSYPTTDKGGIIIKKLTVPTSLLGNDIYYGDTTTLAVNGGTLSKGARWAWYADACGQKAIGYGERIKVSPASTTTYFIRGESATEKTTCLSIIVNVDPSSESAKQINAKRFSCADDKRISLSVSGGRLGRKAEWVWYTDGCAATPLGKGSSITVLPTKKTTYFVRAEGDAGPSACRFITIDPLENTAKDPVSITGTDNICIGQYVTLSVNGGSLSFDQKWVWYKGYISSATQFASGASIKDATVRSQLYYVRGEGLCGNTAAVSFLVKTETLSKAASYISYDGSRLYRNKAITFRKVGGSLGENNEWVWYRVVKGKTKKIGTGEKVRVRLKKDQSIQVQAQGRCSKTALTSTTIHTHPSFFFINGGLSSGSLSNLPGVSKGTSFDSATFVVTIGQVKKINWYFSAKAGLKQAPVSTYSCNDNTVTNYTRANASYTYAGKTSDYRLGITAGTLYGFNNFYCYGGVGYGRRKLSWQFDEYALPLHNKISSFWAENTNKSVSGLEVELGFLLKLSFLNIRAGASGIASLDNKITFKYFDGHVGLGINF
jgi:hypothetical protein